MTESDQSQGGDLRLSRLLALVQIALTRRPLTLVVLAALTIYLPNYLVDRLLPAPPQSIWSLGFVWWSIQVLPLSSITSLFQA